VVHDFSVVVPLWDLATRNVRIAGYKSRIAQILDQVRKRFRLGATGAQTAGLQSELIDQFVVLVLLEALQTLDDSSRHAIETQSQLIAIGGTGRAEMCPHSDLDLLFLSTPAIAETYQFFAAQVQRDLWDSGLKLGASVRTVAEGLQWSKHEPQFATSLVDARPLWGSATLGEKLLSRYRQFVRSNSHQFIANTVAAREKERADQSTTTQQLEPDVKRSLGGLRDIHLIRWIGFAAHSASNFDSLRMKGVLSKEEARRLVHAHEFLTTLRIDLHLAAGREQDVLSREEQLRIAGQRGITATGGQAPVERFMQQYFEHSTSVAAIAKRLVATTRKITWSERLFHGLTAYRIDDIYYVGFEFLDISRRHRQAACRSIEGVLNLFLAAARCRVRVAPHLVEFIKSQHLSPPAHLSADAARTFLALLKTHGMLGAALRDLHDTGVLEAVLPCWKHIRCLLQFNQYHHFTVDEHTLRAIESAENFESDPGPVGKAYRDMHHKELLHLALLLHDAGKGFEEDHSEVGRRLAADSADRLGLPEHQRELVMMLVHRHLQMADLALRRDIGDATLLLKFSHDVGSPDALRMLFVLTAADISAVGPGTWNQWKADLTVTLYDRTMLWLSGKSHLFDEATRLKQIEHLVIDLFQTQTRTNAGARFQAFDINSLQERLQQCPAHYLLETPPERIVEDFVIANARTFHEIHVTAAYDKETETVEYRVILDENIASGCFHKLAGVLAAKRLEILSAMICTTQGGLIIDVFRVRDSDHSHEIPSFRIDEIAAAIRRVLRGETEVETLLRSRGRFAVRATVGPHSDLPLRVVVDNDSSDRCTIIDVFAHDRPGLLYAIGKVLFELDLSVLQAKITTHFDQVLDVFFVTDGAGCKIHDGARLTAIRECLSQQINIFENDARSDS